jgi:hypothetical protein
MRRGYERPATTVKTETLNHAMIEGGPPWPTVPAAGLGQAARVRLPLNQAGSPPR